MRDKTGFQIMVGDRVIFADSEGTDLAKGRVVDIGNKMVSIERDEGQGWPRKVRRYPEQIVVVNNLN